MFVLFSTVFWLSSALLGYVYVLYPFLIRILATKYGRPPIRDQILRPVTIIVTAYNEQACILEKLHNLARLEYPPGLVELLVVSDASSDTTEQIARDFALRPVKVLRVEGRQGKTACQNAAALAATGEILVFTDATTRLHSSALQALVSAFGDPKVGCVGGRLEYVTDIENVTGHGGEAYWSYEMRLRAAESAFGSLIGVSGCLYAVRKSAYRPIDPDLISDFAIAMKMREQRLLTILAADACCFESTLATASRELAMRVRVAVRSLHALVRERRFLNPIDHGRFAWELWSHKVLRYASPLLWIASLGANVLLATHANIYVYLLALQIVLIGTGTAGFALQNRRKQLGWLSRPYYLLLTNAASLIATIRYLRGERMVVWTPVRQ
jgi:cellulose synthase/poly-beta-1,6-N-acetylglucosamine synthase-like glycosyltransferase